MNVWGCGIGEMVLDVGWYWYGEVVLDVRWYWMRDLLVWDEGFSFLSFQLTHWSGNNMYIASEVMSTQKHACVLQDNYCATIAPYQAAFENVRIGLIPGNFPRITPKNGNDVGTWGNSIKCSKSLKW